MSQHRPSWWILQESCKKDWAVAKTNQEIQTTNKPSRQPAAHTTWRWLPRGATSPGTRWGPGCSTFGCHQSGAWNILNWFECFRRNYNNFPTAEERILNSLHSASNQSNRSNPLQSPLEADSRSAAGGTEAVPLLRLAQPRSVPERSAKDRPSSACSLFWGVEELPHIQCVVSTLFYVMTSWGQTVWIYQTTCHCIANSAIYPAARHIPGCLESQNQCRKGFVIVFGICLIFSLQIVFQPAATSASASLQLVSIEVLTGKHLAGQQPAKQVSKTGCFSLERSRLSTYITCHRVPVCEDWAPHLGQSPDLHRCTPGRSRCLTPLQHRLF